MARYTTLSPEELANIVAHYEIGTSVKFEEIHGGFGNSNFKLTTADGLYLLKICDEKSLAELQMQIALLAHLRKHAYPTVYPILQKNGDALHIASNYNVMIYPFLDGGTPQPSQHVSAQIGETLAKLHCISPLAELPRFPMGITQITPFLGEVKDTQFATHPFLIWLKSELEWIKLELDKSLPTGLLHGDLFLDNTLFDGDQMIAILDFEEGCRDTLMIDIGMTIIGCCYTAQHQLDVASVQGFLDAYNTVRPLMDEEWDSLDGYVHYAALAIAFWRFRQYNIRRPDAHRADTYLEMITRSANWQSIRLYSMS
jgi:homoserine kinase type II